MLLYLEHRKLRIAVAEDTDGWDMPGYPVHDHASHNIGRVVMSRCVVEGITIEPGFYPGDGLAHLFKAKEKRQNRIAF